MWSVVLSVRWQRTASLTAFSQPSWLILFRQHACTISTVQPHYNYVLSPSNIHCNVYSTFFDVDSLHWTAGNNYLNIRRKYSLSALVRSIQYTSSRHNHTRLSSADWAQSVATGVHRRYQRGIETFRQTPTWSSHWFNWIPTKLDCALLVISTSIRIQLIN